MPQIVLLLLSQLIVRSEDGEVVSRGFVQEFLQPFAHFLASPAHHGTVVYGECPVRDNQLLVNANHLAETLASRAGADGRVERKHLVARLLEGDAVGLELGAEGEELCASILALETEQASAVAFIHGCLCRVGQAADGGLVVVGTHAVNQQIDICLLAFSLGLKLHEVILDAHHLAVHFHPHETLFHVDVQLLG